MNAEELASKFKAKIAAAVAEKERQAGIAADNMEKRTADVEHCKQALERVPRLEREGDRIFRQGVSKLFAGDFKAMDVLKWKDILDQMEAGMDHCEDIANAAESIALLQA